MRKTNGAAAALAALAALTAGAGAADAQAPATEHWSSTALSSRLDALAGERGVASLSRADQSAALSLPAHGPGSLLRGPGGSIVVQVRGSGGADGATRAAEASDAVVLDVSESYDTVTAAVSPGSLSELAARPGVEAVTEVLAPITGEANAATGPVEGRVNTCAGAVTSEGDVQLNAKSARNGFNIDGAGVKVGVLSDSYDRFTGDAKSAAQDIASGDLPGAGNPCGRTNAVQVLDDSLALNQDPDDEGRAMAQIVHDLAPGARLAFATGSTGALAFADNIRDLAAAGAKVIVDDLTYLDEPFFQDGPIAVAVNDVTAQGVTYVSNAGNQNIISGGRNVASFEAPALRLGSCSPAFSGSTCMDFDAGVAVDGTYELTVPAGQTVRMALQWAEPWNGVVTDLNAYLVDTSNNLVASSLNNNATTKTPFEFLGYTNSSGTSKALRLVIARVAGTGTPRLKFAFIQNGGQSVIPTTYTVSNRADIVGPTIFGHNGAANALSTAAVPYTSSGVAEPFTSRGPVTHYFGPVTGSSAAPALASPKTIAKPDLAATDGGRTTFFTPYTSGIYRFFGTSAAAPHAAAVAALALDAFPSLSVAQVKNALRSTARAVGALGPDAVGGGLVDAQAAVRSVAPKITINDVSKVEGDSGTQNYVFQLTLSKASSAPVSVRYSTGGGTAAAGTDYTAVNNVTASFATGTTTKNVTIAVKGDTVVEPDETFEVRLNTPTRARIADGKGLGTIRNDSGG